VEWTNNVVKDILQRRGERCCAASTDLADIQKHHSFTKISYGQALQSQQRSNVPTKNQNPLLYEQVNTFIRIKPSKESSEATSDTSTDFFPQERNPKTSAHQAENVKFNKELNAKTSKFDEAYPVNREKRKSTQSQ
jgi:hypothetical protein